MKFLLSSLKLIGAAILIVVGLYKTIFEWGVDIATSVVNPQIEKVMAVRNADYQHINDRFNRLEEIQDQRFDKIENLIKEYK